MEIFVGWTYLKKSTWINSFKSFKKNKINIKENKQSTRKSVGSFFVTVIYDDINASF